MPPLSFIELYLITFSHNHNRLAYTNDWRIGSP
jgi:hypothetical protein